MAHTLAALASRTPGSQAARLAAGRHCIVNQFEAHVPWATNALGVIRHTDRGPEMLVFDADGSIGEIFQNLDLWTLREYAALMHREPGRTTPHIVFFG
jgi:hypothetical protein